MELETLSPAALWHQVYIWLGLSSPDSPWYLFWSGIGADWTRLLTFGGLLHVGSRLSKRHIEQRDRHHSDTMNRNSDK